MSSFDPCMFRWLIHDVNPRISPPPSNKPPYKYPKVNMPPGGLVRRFTVKQYFPRVELSYTESFTLSFVCCFQVSLLFFGYCLVKLALLF